VQTISFATAAVDVALDMAVRRARALLAPRRLVGFLSTLRAGAPPPCASPPGRAPWLLAPPPPSSY